MALQTIVNRVMGHGVAGELFDNSPRRADPYEIRGATIEGSVYPAIVGHAFTLDSADSKKAVIGANGGGDFGGLLISPKQYVNRNNFDPSMEVADNTAGELITFGRVFVKTVNAIKAGFYVFFDNKSGAIEGHAEATAQEGKTLIKNARFILESATAGGVAIVQLGD